MSIATLTHPVLLTPLHSLFRWFKAGSAPAGTVPGSNAKVIASATDFVANFSASTGTIKVNRSPSGQVHSLAHGLRKPEHVSRRVRVSRLVEEGQAPANVGRMVISGRMEDVCAELDRLVLREATLH